ncbi:MAG: outer membrane protein assembly factor [Bacteroidetes bacterium QS_8_64_10]|nr:MAG: outer membrane protein assembly factor [Bacteroidetes bacterium QS_8_64_10]
MHFRERTTSRRKGRQAQAAKRSSPPLSALISSVLLVVLLAASLPTGARAQAPLRLVNRNTTVGNISFKFAGSQTFTASQLKEQIALQGPTFWDAVRRIVPLAEARIYPFDPVILQKDVVRLRRFYARNGFPRADIGYPASQLDTSSNKVSVVFSIEEGPPLIIQDVGFFAPDSDYAVTQFSGKRRQQWIDFRNANIMQTGERFSEPAFIDLYNQVSNWLGNHGYAFHEINGDSTISEEALTADVRFTIDPGPLGRISQINVEGNERVSDEVIRRELPFEVGDRYRGNELSRAKQELFSLNLFRLAIVEVPSDQPRDSTVTINVRVQESEPRYVSAQTGFTRDDGVLLEGRWTHRNFFGGARNFTANATVQPGLGNRGDSELYAEEVYRRLRLSTALRQPHLFQRNLSGILSPYFIMEQTFVRNQKGNNTYPLTYEAGLNTTLLYKILPFRIVTLEHNFSRAATPERVPITRDLPGDVQTRQDLYNKSVFTLSATLGRVDDYLNPKRGFLVRPFAEASGQFLGSALNYYKVGGEGSYYQPVTPSVSVAAHVSGGRMVAIAGSRYNEEAAFNERGFVPDPDRRQLENRFDDIRFYAGGANDVRGWGPRLLGPKVAQADTVFEDPDPDDDMEAFEPVCADDGEDENENNDPDDCMRGNPVQFRNYRYERIGGLSKLAVNLEARLPFPFLGPNWGTAVFLDFGQVSEGSVLLSDFRYGTGAGLRYETPVGHVRLNLAYKINPTDEDLIDPQDAFNRNIGRDQGVERNFWRRFRLHFSIGQAF